MGFEITYFYKESNDTPGNYGEEVLSKTTKIGKFEEEVSLDVLAGKIISQLARRNILIVDIEIFEYTKKKISYKETPNGIFIKNKKFSFDSGAMVRQEEENIDEELSEILQNEKLLEKIKKHLNIQSKNCSNDSRNSNINLANRTSSSSSKRALRQEVYDPEITTKFKIEQKGYKFTVGRKYSIFSEKSFGGAIVYQTKDDTGREVEVASDCFIVPPAGLSFDEEPQYYGGDSQDVDLWKNVRTEENMPDIRRR